MAQCNYDNENGTRGHRAGTMPRHEYLLRASEFAARGQGLPQAKLLNLDVISIRSAARQRDALRKHIADHLSNAALAKKYGVHINNIEKIIRREAWSHIP